MAGDQALLGRTSDGRGCCGIPRKLAGDCPSFVDRARLNAQSRQRRLDLPEHEHSNGLLNLKNVAKFR
jgi:hypothetical protein